MPPAMLPAMPSASTICLRVEPERGADAGGRAHRPENRGRMEAGLVHGFGHHKAEAAQHLGADGNPDQRHAAVGIMPLAGGEHRRHDHRAGMHRAALERVVEILAMRRGAVDKGRARRGQCPLVADRGAGAVIVAAAECAADIILVSRGDAETDHVDQQILAFARGHLGQAARLQRDDLLAKRLRDGHFRQSGTHDRRSDVEDLGVARLDLHRPAARRPRHRPSWS